MAFIALRCSVALSALWPPERNAIPGTAAGLSALSAACVQRLPQHLPASDYPFPIPPCLA